MGMGAELSFVATGDSFITRRLPATASPQFQELSNLIRQGDFRFTNFEVSIPGEKKMPSAVCGGTWASAKPEVVSDLKEYGFNCTSWGTNHTLDYLYSGLSETRRQLDKAGFVYAGAGENMAEASSPKYVETLSGRVALIALTSTFHETWLAGEQRRDIEGRPGVNGLRFISNYQTDAAKLKLLKEVAEQTGINAQRNLDILEGFSPEDREGEVSFGGYKFTEGPFSGLRRVPHPDDMERIIQSIHEAKRQADYVVVSIHSHEMQGENKQVPAEFIESAARNFIDEGAHAIVGHGPHIMRGIEIYKKRPIFYSLGNFIFQNDTIEYLPADFYEKYGLSSENTVADGLDKRSKENTIGLGANPLVWEAVIPHWKMKDGKLTELSLHPIELGFGLERYQRGWPTLSDDGRIIETVRKLSESYGTKIEIENNIGFVRL